MGRGLLLVCVALTASCLGSSAQGGQGVVVGGGAAADALKQWPYGAYGYGPASLYKRLPAQYNFGLGKRSPGNKLYSFGLGKRAADYEDDAVEEDEAALVDDQMDDPMQDEKRSRAYEFGLGKRRAYDFGLGKRARSYEFGLGKRARSYEFGLGKRRSYDFGLGKRARSYEFGLGKRSGDRKLYSFGLGKRLPTGERRYAFGLGKRSGLSAAEQAESEEQAAVSSAATDAAPDATSNVGKREVADKDLQQVAAETQGTAPRSKRAAPEPDGFAKRADEEPEDVVLPADEDDAPRSALTLEDLLADEGLLLVRPTRAKQYGFGLGKRRFQYGYQYGDSKRGPRQQYSFGLGRRSMQYNFGIGKRSGSAPADR